MNLRFAAVLAATALAAFAAWPWFVATREAQASLATPAPVVADYRQRDRLVAFYEDAVRRRPDQIVTRLLAAQYLQRFRERSDPADLARGEHAANESLAIQPHFNVAAEMTLAAALASLHRFRAARVHAERARLIEPGNSSAAAQLASIDVELGFYDEASRLLHVARGTRAPNVALATAVARYDEVTGGLAQARRSIDAALAETDAVIDSPAESRAWFHFRAGELAWSAGDGATAEHRYREALEIFPGYPRALNGLARMYWAQRRWREARDAAARSAGLVPLPETLGYEADAQRALGEAAAARATEDAIAAIARVGNAGGLSDRALAIYFADHRLRPAEAVAIAQRDAATRDDVFAEDALAWALLRAGTQDARLQYHAGVIAMECGDGAEGARRLQFALELNPQFHPFDAGDARRRLSAAHCAVCGESKSRVGDPLREREEAPVVRPAPLLPSPVENYVPI